MSEHLPRKRFGQHFLKDEHVIQDIVSALAPQPQDNIVEIGAGLGALTKLVLEQTEHLHVVEIDRDLVAKLIATYSPKQMTVHSADALKFNFAQLYGENAKKLRVFGNLPYNISTPLMFHLLTFRDKINDMLFMLQKEVVMRMGAKPNTKDYGRLSVMIQYACAVDILFHVGPEAFSPPPKVMSSIVRLTPLSKESGMPVAQDEKLLAKIVASAFQYRRKTLKNALSSLVTPDLFVESGIDPIRRAETLTVREYVHLSNTVTKSG
jgi:16S rRNA (adenine1518-N6/adenine1519-N6)-dimethyltransferase